jgi:hypothetical protein
MAAGHFQPLLWVFRACRFSLEHLSCHEKDFFGIPEVLALEATIRRESHLIADFDQSEMMLETNYDYLLASRDSFAGFRASAPQLSAHDYGALRIQFGVYPSHLANQLDVADTRFLVTVQSNDQSRGEQGNTTY